MSRSIVLLLSLLCLICCQSTIQEGGNASADSTASTRSIPDHPAMETPAPLDTIPLKYLLGQFDPESDSQFQSIDTRFSGGSALRQKLHRETHAAFEKMWQAAKQDGISLTILSATRNFYYQKSIWEAKWNGQRNVEGKNLAQTVPDPAERALTILRYSSMPGTSRHHWGTDIDINSFNNSYFEQGKGKAEYEWLRANGPEYGFCQVYSPKGEDRPYGYEEEKWHWSYLPLADRYLKSYAALVTPDMITGFAGAEVAEEIQVIDRYVFGINPSCKD